MMELYSKEAGSIAISQFNAFLPNPIFLGNEKAGKENKFPFMAPD